MSAYFVLLGSGVMFSLIAAGSLALRSGHPLHHPFRTSVSAQLAEPNWLRASGIVSLSRGGPTFCADLLSDLQRTDWQPLKPERSPFLNPCFLSSFLTGGSVVASMQRGLFFPFGVGPLLVLLSSILYWSNPVKESWRRAVDVRTVRIGLAAQVLLAARYCSPASVALPQLAMGYALGMTCYAGGRILTVRGRLWPGALVHCGVHVFANAGNLLILPYASV